MLEKMAAGVMATLDIIKVECAGVIGLCGNLCRKRYLLVRTKNKCSGLILPKIIITTTKK